MKAILRSWDKETIFDETQIELDDRYDEAKGPYHPDNEDFCPVVGSNQEIVIPEPLVDINGFFVQYLQNNVMDLNTGLIYNISVKGIATLTSLKYGSKKTRDKLKQLIIDDETLPEEFTPLFSGKSRAGYILGWDGSTGAWDY